MKKIVIGLLCVCCLLPVSNSVIKANETKQNTYNMVITGEDWGPSTSTIVLMNADAMNSHLASDFEVQVQKKINVKKKDKVVEEESIKVLDVYYADERGNKVEVQSPYVALTIEKGPTITSTSPYYFDEEKFANIPAEVSFQITDKQSSRVWNVKNKEVKLGVEQFKKDTFQYEDDSFGKIDLSYASYTPTQDNEKNPLVIWLHGMGEGGVDPELVLYGNKVTNLISDEIQSYFNGAYVLTPQSPTFWLDQGDGNTTIDGKSMYSNALFALIDSYVKGNKDIDLNRIYIGGCSNGGFMTMRMIIDHPTYFAAAFPICEALYNDYVSDDDIQKIKHMPIWFTHAQEDMLAEPDYITTPTYERLIAAGAKNVHYSLYENVEDTSGFYFMEDNKTPYQYNAHFSWIHTLNNEPNFDYDGSPVLLNDKQVTIFEWLATQTKRKSEYKPATFMEQYGSIVIAFGLVIVIAGAIVLAGKNKEKKEEEN